MWALVAALPDAVRVRQLWPDADAARVPQQKMPLMVMDDTPMKMDDMMSMDDDPDAFCTGMAMSMYMDGFTSSLRHTWWAFASTTAHRREAPGCLNLFFPAWTLDGAGKFAAAAFGVLALGVAVEALSALRRSRAVALARAKHRGRSAAATAETALLYGLQLALGYFLMLAVMTYSVELFVAAVTGVILGHGACRTARDASSALVTSAETCCAGLDASGSGRASPEAGGYCALGSVGARRTASLKVSGMTCQQCADTVTAALLRLPAVDAAAVDLGAATATVTGRAGLEELLAAVDDCGFGAGAA